MKKNLLLFRTIFILLITILFIIHRLGFYYIMLDENNSYRYDELLSINKYIDIYNADIEIFKHEEEIIKASNDKDTLGIYNNITKKEIVNNPMKAVKKAKECFFYLDYGTKEFMEPCFVTYNDNANVWIVQENIYKKNIMFGGEFIAVINAENGEVVYAVHFM